MTQERLKELFEYHPDGYLLSKPEKRLGKVRPRITKGCKSSTGYFVVGVDKKTRKIHRIIFLLLKGYLPSQLDHINRNKADNRIENLRESTQSQNIANVNKYKSNGLPKGVSFDKRRRSYSARIGWRNNHLYIGTFKTMEAAAKAYDAEAKELFGEFANLNFKGKL